MTNRTDELTDPLLDGTLSDADAVELESLLSADPSARQRHLALVRLELELRGLRTEFDIAAATVSALAEARVERTTAAVMAELAQRRSAPRRSRSRIDVAVAALAAMLLVGVWAALKPPAPQPEIAVTGVKQAPFADPLRIAAVTGSVEVVCADRTVPASPDQLLPPDCTLRTVGEESAAVLEFADRSRVEVHSDSAVRLVSTDGGDRKLFLVEGRITAAATGKRIAVSTGTTEAEATQGAFSLWSSGPGSARVEPMAGDVRIVGGAPAEPVVLGPGRAAFVRDEQTPMSIETPLAIDSTPAHRLDFHALDVGVAPDGDVWAISAKQWSRWRPGLPDPGRVPFLPKVFNDGNAALLTPDLRFAALCRIDDRTERIAIRELPSGNERYSIPIRVSEPRFLCIAPDASWVATAGGSKPQNRRITIWDAATGTERFVRELDNTVTCFAASPDGRRLAVGVSDLGKGTDNLIAVFDPHTGERLFDLHTGRKGILSLTFSPDSRQLAAGFNGVVQIWDAAAQAKTQSLEGFERVVCRLAFSPQRGLIAAGTQDGQVWLWSAATGRRVQVLDTGTRGVRSLAFSPDGKFLVTATNKAPVAVWDVAFEQRTPSTSEV